MNGYMAQSEISLMPVASYACSSSLASFCWNESSQLVDPSNQVPPLSLSSVDPDDYQPSGFPARRLLCFVGITAGYMVGQQRATIYPIMHEVDNMKEVPERNHLSSSIQGLYFTRGSLTYCAPLMILDPALGMSITDIGAMTSAFPLAYGMSK